jgi:hypothetical protein
MKSWGRHALPCSVPACHHCGCRRCFAPALTHVSRVTNRVYCFGLPAQVEAQIEHLLARQAALHNERERLVRMRAAEARAPRADWQGRFPWDGPVQQLLSDVFGLSSFRPLQREVINATLQVGAGCLCWARAATSVLGRSLGRSSGPFSPAGGRPPPPPFPPPPAQTSPRAVMCCA